MKKHTIFSMVGVCAIVALMISFVAGPSGSMLTIAESSPEAPLEVTHEEGNMPVEANSYIEHHNISLTGNEEVDDFFAGNETDGLSWESAHIIEGLNISNHIGYGIKIEESTRHIIIQNSIFKNNSESWIYIDNSANIRIIDCTFLEEILFVEFGIYISDSSFIEVISNQFQMNNYGAATISMYSSNILIEDNDINNAETPIGVIYSEDFSVIENRIINWSNQVVIRGSSQGSIFSNEWLYNEHPYGWSFLLMDCVDLDVRYNIINEGITEFWNASYITSILNNFGGSLEIDKDSHHNNFYLNRFDVNSTWFNNLGNNNKFDNGQYGNYWKNFTIDNTGALSSDGIVWDISYGAHNIVDNLPLVSKDFVPPFEIVFDGSSSVDNESIGNIFDIVIVSEYTHYPQCTIKLDGNIVYEGAWESGISIPINVDLLEVGNHLIEVVAHSGVFDSMQSEEFEFEVTIPLPYIPVIISENLNLSTSNMLLRWESSRYAQTYNVYVNGVLINSTAGTMMELFFVYEGDYIVTITAENEHGESQLSESILIVVEFSENNEQQNNIDVFPYWTLSIAIFVGLSIIMLRKNKRLRIVEKTNKYN